MSENYYLISDNDVHMPIRCTMQRFDHIRQQMHDYFELSMIVSGSCTLQFDDHMYNLNPSFSEKRGFFVSGRTIFKLIP